MSRTATTLLCGLMFVCSTLTAAVPPQAADLQTLQAIVAELRELRLAFERSNMLTARLQLAFQRAQAQERRVDVLTREADDLKQSISADQLQYNRGVEQMNEMQTRLSQTTEPAKRKEFEEQMKQTKFEMERAGEMLRVRQEREIEVRNLLQAEKAKLSDFNERLNTLERALEPQR